jgi:hypothetical protein
MANKSRDATPAQLGQIWDLLEESKTGSFGIPTHTYRDGSGYDLHQYELVKVAEVPEIRVNTKTGVPLWRTRTKHRIFRPALEMALGFQERGVAGLFTEAEEVERSALLPTELKDPVTRRTSFANAEVEDQTYPSAYAQSIGRFATKISLDSTVINRVGADQLQQFYAIQYDLRSKKPGNLLPDLLLLNAAHFHSLDLREDSKRALITNERLSFMGPLGWPIIQSRKTTLVTRQEASWIKADLVQIKAEYSSWT